VKSSAIQTSSRGEARWPLDMMHEFEDLMTELGVDRVRDLFRQLMQRALQELIDTELTEAIGAAPHERTETRENRRNGSRNRMLSTRPETSICASPRSGRALWRPSRGTRTTTTGVGLGHRR
jgi:transposase-like protein